VQYDRIDRQRIRVIHNGIDLSKFSGSTDRHAWRAGLGIKKDEFVIGVIARLEEQKGHRFLLEALTLKPECLSKLKVVFVGDGKLRSSLEGESREKGLASHVLFLGTLEPIFPILKALDLFLLPSLWEGFSVAILEAMAAGVPVIATRVGGAEEVITSGREGLLIPPGDAQGLAEAIEDALLHREKFLEMARLGEEKVRRTFSIETHITALTALYLEILRGKGLRPGI
jgi:glycosyltransferase involved in cell wall biosynthesis